MTASIHRNGTPTILVVLAVATLATVLHSAPAAAVSSVPPRSEDAALAPREVELPCVGDCDGDRRVTIAELVRMVRIALGLPTESCDGFGEGISVDVLVRAVNKSLRGCDALDPTPLPPHTATPTPTEINGVTPTPTRTVAIVSEGVDLIVTRVVRERCKDPRDCWPLPSSAVTVCVGNSGDRDSAPVAVELNGEVSNVGAVASGTETCFYRLIGGAITVVVDPDDRVAEIDESNNFVSHPELDPTACDVEAVPCSTTPTPAPQDRCEDCCDHCSNATCVGECVGVTTCTLVADWRGSVTESSSGEPIVNATVTVNGVSGATDADGLYSFRSTRPEVCSGLDYRYEVTVSAPGFVPFTEQFFRTPISGETTRDVTLEQSGS